MRISRAINVVAALLVLGCTFPGAAADTGRLITLKSGTTYRVYGDLLVPAEFQDGVRGALAGSRWPRATLYYTFDSSVSSTHRDFFRQSTTRWEDGSGVRVIENPSASNRVLVQTDSGIGCGSSALGMRGGVQDLAISPDCWTSRTVLHEVGHALGLIHEHQRSNRNTFVSIEDDGIIKHCGQGVWNANFGIIEPSAASAYDYASIMHYQPNVYFDCDPVASAQITALRSQPPGPPDGSESVCTNAASCQGIMGESNFPSARDGYAMALRYGHRVEVSIGGTGTGTVDASGHRESCGANCYLVTPLTSITLVATPAPDSVARIAMDSCVSAISCSFSPSSDTQARVSFVKLSTLRAAASIASTLVFADDDAIFSSGFELQSGPAEAPTARMQ